MRTFSPASPAVTLATAVLAALAIVPLSGCVRVADGPSSASTTTPKATAEPEEAGPHVAGYPEGEFPPVPLFTLPDISLLDDASSKFTASFETELADIPGLRVSPARCGADGQYITGGALTLYGDGSGNVVGPDGAVINYGDGSGVYSRGDSQVVNYGDGSGVYDDGVTTIVNYGDGGGVYTRGDVVVTIYGDGSGNKTDGQTSIVNYGDGSGNFADGDVSIVNYGDGSGAYADGDLSIVNYGDGTGKVNEKTIDMEPIAKVPALGVFPPIGVLDPVEPVCGTLVTLDDSVLFDFDSSDLRPEAQSVLSTLAGALTSITPGRVTVTGHTDSIGSDSYNQTLSEDRAASVVSELAQLGVTGDIESRGAGESEAIAPNEINGADNPAGRQLNRRVEVFIAP